MSFLLRSIPSHSAPRMQVLCPQDTGGPDAGAYEVFFESCECRDLVAKDITATGARTSDPYLRFYGDPVRLLQVSAGR